MKDLSIIIPCYNCEKYIVKCLDSIPVSSDIQIIIVDDCSNDNTVGVINQYMEHSQHRIILKRNDENMGAGETRNVALKLVETEYVTFLDSDDELNTDTFLNMLTLLNEDYDCIVFDVECMNKSRKKYMKAFFSKKIRGGFVATSDAFVFLRGCTWGKIYRYSNIKNNNVVFGNLKKNEDLIFTKTAISNAERIFYVEKPIYYYYMDNINSIMHNSVFCDCEMEAYSCIENKVLRDQFKDELNSVYFLEVVYASTVSAIRQKNKRREIKRKFDCLNPRYDENDRFFCDYFTKYKLAYRIFKWLFDGPFG